MEALGINWMVFIAQLVAFVVVFFVLNKFLFQKIRETLKERRKTVETTFAKQTEIEKRLEKMEIEQKEAHKKTQEEARRILKEAKEAAEKNRKEILAASEKQGEKLVDQAKKRLELETEKASAELVEQAKKLALAMTEQLMEEKINDKHWQEAEIDKAIKRLEKS